MIKRHWAKTMNRSRVSSEKSSCIWLHTILAGMLSLNCSDKPSLHMQSSAFFALVYQATSQLKIFFFNYIQNCLKTSLLMSRNAVLTHVCRQQWCAQCSFSVSYTVNTAEDSVPSLKKQCVFSMACLNGSRSRLTGHDAKTYQNAHSK